MKTKILITGSNGLLGQKLIYKLREREDVDLIAVARGENRLVEKTGYTFVSLDITKKEEVLRVIGEHRPNAIINTAAMTNVDVCETEKEACWDINVNAVAYLAEASTVNNCHLLHISTDFVFDGEDGPYIETDKPNPLHYYAESKLASEKLLENSSCKWAVARTIIVYGITDNMSRSNLVLWAKNALQNKQEIKVINDQFRSPTLAEDLADGCIAIVDRKAEGMYHLSGPKTQSILELVYEVADYFELDKSYITPISSKALNQPAKRPPKTGFIIDKARKDLDYNPRDFKSGIAFLEEQIAQYSN